MHLARQIIGPIFRALPVGLRREIRTQRLERAVRANRFTSDEHEFSRLHEWLSPGDVAIDVGANFGSYTLRMAELVGPQGKVIAFEPVPQTFKILTRLLAARGCHNVTTMNFAASNHAGVASISIPDDPTTGENLYRATIMNGGSIAVSLMRIDDLAIDRLRLVKIDAEGHETQVIDGMWNTITVHKPILIVEHLPDEACARLAALGYTRTRKDRSPNAVFLP